ncbi:MAG: Hint domain-containing protein [Cyanobacteria bacterium J06635_15]
MFHSLIEALKISLIALLLTLCLGTNFAYARGGCFSGDTNILTPAGYKPIEQLHKGDRIIGLNLATHQPEEEEIGDIQVVNAPDYFLINNSIKVTGTHPFYIKKGKELTLLQVQALSSGDQLLKADNTPTTISSVIHVNHPLKVYNLLSITPDHNFYAEGILVHNKGGGGGGGSAGAGGYGGGGVTIISKKTLPGLILSLAILVILLTPFSFLRELYNLIRFRNKEFTSDSELLKFTKTINPRFTNQYSARYFNDEEFWVLTPAASELDTCEYEEIVSRSDLIDQISCLFVRYQEDWSRKDFDSVKAYVTKSFYKIQYDRSLKDFGDNFDITYEPELFEIVPLSYTQLRDNCLFKVQINAKMVNFEISSKGFVLSGEPYPRSFTEYWDIAVDNTKKCLLAGIEQVSIASVQ